MEVDGYGNTYNQEKIVTTDIVSKYPKEVMPRWWQLRAKSRFRHTLLELKTQQLQRQNHLDFVQAIQEALRHTQIAGNHTLHHTYAQRPAAQRPSRLTIVYCMQDGTEIREYVNLNSQHYTVTAPMHYVWNQELPPVNIRYEFGYTDGGKW